MKNIIVYYSLSGNTEYAAGIIADALHADILRIEPKHDYPRNGFRKFYTGGKSAVLAQTPELKPYDFAAASYDRIILGFPVWAASITPPIRTFILENDLSGKQVAAFVCQSGFGGGKVLARLKTALGRANLEAETILTDPQARPSADNEDRIAAFCRQLG